MDKDFIAHSYEYGVWADRRLLDKAALLTDEQLRHKFTQGAQSILHSFVHLVSAEWRWFQAWQSIPLMNPLTAEDLPTLDAVRAKWEPLFGERRAYIESLTPEKLASVIKRKLGDQERIIPLWLALIHVANHGTQHRSEIASMLTDAGQSPGDLDMPLYFRDLAAGKG
ncbi:MAG: DinB family protein [Chloroflexi bacterium]|nr:DinB family protein [Chloroflexota bacterium]